ncbi:MAG: hypothetical protein R3C44_24670 [Chloroflexota bacterium]
MTAQPIAQLAEAYLETGQTDKAIEYAYRVLNLEVPLSAVCLLHAGPGSPATG